MTPDWPRILPDADFRWTMGLRTGTVSEFFAARDATGEVTRERARWLGEDPEKYSAMPTRAEAALRDTVALATREGGRIDPALSPIEQLHALGRFWEPDFLWMLPDDAGRDRLAGGVLCFPSSWDLRDKLGQSMADIHAPVPGLNEALARQIDAFLGALQPGAAWTRENLSFRRDARLNHHPSLPYQALDATIAANEVFIRLEHQLLLRLAPSGAILFGIRIEIVPLPALLKDPVAATRLARELRTIPESAAAYKGIAAARPRLLELIDAGVG